MMKYHALIPVRDFSNTKLRLRNSLTERQRSELTSALLDVVLRSIQQSKIDDILVIATQPDEVLSKQNRFSKLKVVQEVRKRGGVNNAFIQGMGELSQDEEISSFFLLPSDLPFVNRNAVDQAISHFEGVDVLINPSRKMDGTNLLVMRSNTRIPLHYDDNSYFRHLEECKKLNLRTKVLQEAPFSDDVDDGDDLFMVEQKLGVSTIQELILELGKERS